MVEKSCSETVWGNKNESLLAWHLEQNWPLFFFLGTVFYSVLTFSKSWDDILCSSLCRSSDHESYSVEFVFDADVKCAVTVHYRATEDLSTGLAMWVHCSFRLFIKVWALGKSAGCENDFPCQIWLPPGTFFLLRSSVQLKHFAWP